MASTESTWFPTNDIDVVISKKSIQSVEMTKSISLVGNQVNSVLAITRDGETEYLSSGRHMIHAHILIQTKHYTKLQFFAQAFREQLAKEMNLPSA